MGRIVLFLLVMAFVVFAARRMMDAVRGGLEIPDRAPKGSRADTMPPASDEELESGEWLHRVLTDAYAAETEAWALDRVRRIDERLQRKWPPGARFRTEVLWIPEATAFTAPGPYVYLSRRLLERTPLDEPIAFAVAHEIAHHDLGHLKGAERWRGRLPGGAFFDLLGAALADLRLAAYSPEAEADADAHALNLCLAAGYDPHRCLQLFDVLEADALDAGDVEGAFGSAKAADLELDGAPAWKAQLATWLYERGRGYPALRERKERLLAAYEEAAAAQKA